ALPISAGANEKARRKNAAGPFVERVGLLGHVPGGAVHALAAQALASSLERFFQFYRVGVDAAGHFAAGHRARFGAVNDGDAEFTVTLQQRPGDAFERFEGAISDQRSEEHTSEER